MQLDAVFPPMATVFARDGSVDSRAISSNVSKWIHAGVGGVVALGSNGEAPFVDDDEAEQVIAAARESVPRDRVLIVGTGRESTRATIVASARAAALGADAVLVRTPSFYKARMTADVFVRHYTAVADAASVPVLLYNVPAVTGVSLTSDAVGRLAVHPNIIGVKETGSDTAQVAAFVEASSAAPHGSAVGLCRDCRIGADLLPLAVRRRDRWHPGGVVRAARALRAAARAFSRRPSRRGARAAASPDPARQARDDRPRRRGVEERDGRRRLRRWRASNATRSIDRRGGVTSPRRRRVADGRGPNLTGRRNCNDDVPKTIKVGARPYNVIMRRRLWMRTAGRALAVLFAAGFACAAYIYLTLPDVRVLRTQNPPTTAFIELRTQEAIDKGEQPRRIQRWVSYARISPSLKRAVIVTEDAAFWQHGGVDFQQLKESMEVNLERMEFARGASTITQQLAKNLYLSPSKNPIRKGREILIARRLEAELSKQRILELYLNLIEWGNGIYGAEAAARTYFRKAAADLGPQESSLLAAGINSPRAFDPARPSARLRRRQEMILRRMGAVTPPPVIAEPVSPAPGPDTGEIPATSPSEGVPVVLPGEVVPPSRLPRPPGGPPPPGP